MNLNTERNTIFFSITVYFIFFDILEKRILISGVKDIQCQSKDARVLWFKSEWLIVLRVVTTQTPGQTLLSMLGTLIAFLADKY
jgi:hypothetical protein